MEEFTREVVIPAALSTIFEQIFSFLLDKFPMPSWGGVRDADRARLEQLLRRIGSAVEEAEGRHITNLQLLGELKSLIDTMYRGRFALEAADLDDVVEKATCKRKFGLCSPLNAAKKRARLILGGGDCATTDKRLASVVEEMEALRGDYMRDFILLVQGYPRRCNNVPRPLTTTLFMDRCVFGRHVETERIVAFLLQPAPRRSGGLSALAVVGAGGVGKTTLVKHALDDERVRDHFAHVEWFQWMEVIRAGGWCWRRGVPQYLGGVRNILNASRFESVGRTLLVFKDAEPVKEANWAAVLAAASSKLAEGSKLIFRSHDADVARTIVGTTTEPVVLDRLGEEEYWYYFKAFAFAGADPRDHPRMAAVARDIFHHLERGFTEARVLGTLLRANFNARYWRRVLDAIIKKCPHSPRPLYVEVLFDLLPIVAGGRNKSYGYYLTSPEPRPTLLDVLGASTTSPSSASSLGVGNMDTILLCRETLYMDRWYYISSKDAETTTAAGRHSTNRSTYVYDLPLWKSSDGPRLIC